MISRSIFSFLVFFISTAFLVKAQFTPGQTYLGSNGYIEYRAGNLPIVISAPHGGYLEPASIPDRNCSGCSTLRDSRTQEMAYQVDSAIQVLFGGHPHVIVNRLARIKLDANREIVEAALGNQEAETAWSEYHAFIQAAKDRENSNFGSVLFIDLHGHGHPIQRLELGYMLTRSQLQGSNSTLDISNLQNSSSIRHLKNVLNPSTSFAEILRGNECMGEFLLEHGYPGTPSASDTAPAPSDPYFSGGYNTGRHGSRDSSSSNAIQFELNWTGVRDSTTNRRAFASSLACALRDYLDRWYFDLDAWDPGNLVSSTADHGPGSLRAALLGAEDGEVITFAPGLLGDTIRLEQELRICSEVTLQGPGDSLLAVSGGGVTRLLSILATDSVTISGLSWVDGRSPAGQDGGGILVEGKLKMTDCTLADNHSQDDGGAINLRENAHVYLERCTVRDNSCADDGAGIRNFQGNLNLYQCRVTHNTSPSLGGGLSSNGFVSVQNSTFSGNSAVVAGGGIRSFGGSVTIENSTFDSNQAGNRGGALSSSTNLNLDFVTLVNNSATSEGGAVEVEGAVCTLRNTLLAFNTASSGPDAFVRTGGSFASLGHNLLRDSTGSNWLPGNADQFGNANTPLDPMVLPIAHNGGYTRTVGLVPGSPCVDAGDSLGAPMFDQRGVARTLNGAADIGAFEYQSPVGNLSAPTPNRVHLFPNPANNHLKIEFDQAGSYQLSASNLIGQVFWQSQMFQERNTSLDVSQWPAGAYWLRVEGELVHTSLFLVH